MPWSPGNFATVTSKTGIMRIWNASQSNPLYLIRIGHTGIQNFFFLSNTNLALCTFTDGSVCIYHMKRKRLEWMSNVSMFFTTLLGILYEANICNIHTLDRAYGNSF